MFLCYDFNLSSEDVHHWLLTKHTWKCFPLYNTHKNNTMLTQVSEQWQGQNNGNRHQQHQVVTVSVPFTETQQDRAC